MKSLNEQLEQGLVELGADLKQTQSEQLLALLDLLQHWNKAFNLTAVRKPEQMVILHLLDSLVLSEHIHGNKVIDVGTGAGFPGLPLAIANPEKNFILLDSNFKKIRFVQQAVLELGLTNVSVAHDRFEHYQPDYLFDSIFARAVSSLSRLADQVSHLLAANGKILVPKGQYPEDELQQLGSRPVSVLRLVVPGMNAERHLVCIENLEQ